MAIGDIGAVLATGKINGTTNCYNPWAVRIAEGIIAVVAGQPTTTVTLFTKSIAGDGTVGALGSVNATTSALGNYPNASLCHVNGTVWAVPFTKGGANVATVNIPLNGVGPSLIATGANFYSCAYPRMIHTTGTKYAIVEYAAGYVPYLRTVNIPDDGSSITEIDYLKYVASGFVYSADIIHVSGTVYAIFCMTAAGNKIVTVNIPANGVNPTIINTGVQIHATQTYWPKIINITGNIFLCIGNGISTVNISSDGSTITVLQNLLDDTGLAWASLMHLAEDVYLCSYNNTGGWMKSFSCTSDGLTLATIDKLQFSTANPYPSLQSYVVFARDDLYTVSYQGSDDDGWVKTADVVNSAPAGRNQIIIVP